MSKEKVTVKITEKNLQKFNEFIEKLTSKLKDLEIGLFRFGRIGEEVLVSFSVNSKFYTLVIENLRRNDFNVLFIDEKATRAQKTIGLKRVMENTKPTTWSDLKNKTEPQQEDIPIEDLAKNGDYEGLIKIALDSRQGLKKTEDAKNLLNSAVTVAIDSAYNNAIKNKREADNSLKSLLKIATNSNLKNLHKIDLVKKAGLLAIDLCQLYDTLVGDLISICTNNKVHNLVTIKAAIALSDRILIHQDSYVEEKELAIRNINIRWLYMAYDVVMKDITKDEMNSLNTLIQFVETARAKN